MKDLDALRRLGNAGSANSSSYAKLRQAANIVAAKIEDAATVNDVLPRGYVVTRKCCQDAHHCITNNCRPAVELYLVNADGEFLAGTGKAMCENSYVFIPVPTSDAVVKFAHDIADGLLLEIAQHIERESREFDCLTSTLSVAMSKD